MTDEHNTTQPELGLTPEHDETHVQERAQLLPEEEAVDSADSKTQAEAILAESDERAEQAERDRRHGDEPIERRDSSEAI